MDFTNRIIASIVFCGLSINGIAQTLTGCVVGKDDRKPIDLRISHIEGKSLVRFLLTKKVVSR